MRTLMCADDMAWECAENISHNWLLQFLKLDIKKPIAMFILQRHRGDGAVFTILEKGSYNISLRMKYEKNHAVVIRLAQPGAVFFPEEKVVNEVATMRLLTDQTSIPVPFILDSGTKKESPLELSPFIMMEYIEHKTNMYDALNTPGCPKKDRGILDPNIDVNTLELLYDQLVDDFTWEVSRRPLSMNMNELVRLGSLPRSKIPHTTFSTASCYFEALADLNIEHLVHQRNDAVESADDCRRKFIARQLFRKLAREKRLTDSIFEQGPFKIWCDDLRPGNILLHENMQIAGVVDWEFTYTAPVEFSHAPPWWLLIEKPELWPNGMDNWEDVHMQRSWDSGNFWIVYAALNSFAFDAIYWKKIDPLFFKAAGSPETAWKERLDLLAEKEIEEMEQLVVRKLEEKETRVLKWDPDEYTVEAKAKAAEVD
ncbi:hypothetical protein N7489_006018 [Penicillium chrysogenum]|nr:uncharacterized protein N7489_006018 [Penicillium chrysogenum]KAJ5235927.1 hypothetical protein N7489_006018 [Penicillium chrysogenum]